MTDRRGPVQPGQPPEPGPGVPDPPGAGQPPSQPGPHLTGQPPSQPGPHLTGQPPSQPGPHLTGQPPGQPRAASLPGMPSPAQPSPGQPTPPRLPGPADPTAPGGGPGGPARPDLPGQADLPGKPDLPGKAGPGGLPSLHDQATPLAATAPVSATSRAAAKPPDSGPAGPAVEPATSAGTAASGLDLDRLASLVSERMAEPEIPPAEQAVLLREKAPELYDLWLRIAQDKAETDNYVHRAPYEVPERLASSGRPRALGAMVVVLAFCGYLASLGGPGVYIGGLLALLDLLIMLVLFFGLRPEHLTEPGRARKRRLSRLRARCPGYLPTPWPSAWHTAH